MATTEEIAFYDNFIGHFDEQKDNARNREFRALVRKYLRKPAKVLDVGCALGYNSGWLAEEGCAVHGIDISPQCILQAQERYPQSLWWCGDITEGFDFSTGGFTLILMSDVIEHVPLEKHGAMFANVSRVAEPGCLLLGAVPDPEIHATAKQAMYQPVEERVDIPTLLAVAGMAGFSRIVSVYLRGTHYVVVLQRVERSV